jgi:hypothetical protein
MSLLDVLSLDGLHLALSEAVEDRLSNLRLVSRDIKRALEKNACLKINVYVSNEEEQSLMADFLQRWQGSLNLHYTRRGWTPDSTWFKGFKDAILLGRFRPPSLLSLLVDESNLLQLAEALRVISTAIQRFRILYQGKGAELLAAAEPLASLGRALTLEISLKGEDLGGAQTSLWLQQLHASSIEPCSISFR